jgi:hypothetical protein
MILFQTQDYCVFLLLSAVLSAAQYSTHRRCNPSVPILFLSKFQCSKFGDIYKRFTDSLLTAVQVAVNVLAICSVPWSDLLIPVHVFIIIKGGTLLCQKINFKFCVKLGKPV